MSNKVLTILVGVSGIKRAIPDWRNIFRERLEELGIDAFVPTVEEEPLNLITFKSKKDLNLFLISGSVQNSGQGGYLLDGVDIKGSSYYNGYKIYEWVK